MNDKTGQAYENLAQAIFQSIPGQKEVSNVIVERDVTLQGKTTTHQIDIYWKFQKGIVSYETIVQAKDWSKPVDKGQLLLFKEILDDLPNQPRGIVVTRSRYQAGAKDVALAHGILLYELREMADEPSLARSPLPGVGERLIPIQGEAQDWKIGKAVVALCQSKLAKGKPEEPRKIARIGTKLQMRPRFLPGSDKQSIPIGL